MRFDEIAEHLETFADKPAERAAAPGGYGKRTARLATPVLEISKYPTNAVDGME